MQDPWCLGLVYTFDDNMIYREHHTIKPYLWEEMRNLESDSLLGRVVNERQFGAMLGVLTIKHVYTVQHYMSKSEDT